MIDNVPPTFEEALHIWQTRQVSWDSFGIPNQERPAARTASIGFQRHVYIPISGQPHDKIESVHFHRVIFERRILGRPGQPADYEAVFYQGCEIERIPARPFAGVVPIVPVMRVVR